MYKFPPKNTKPKNRFSDDVKTGFGFAKLAGFTGFPVLAKTGFHSLLYMLKAVTVVLHYKHM